MDANSGDSAAGVDVTFANNYGESVRLFWFQDNGQRLIQGEMGPGEELVLGTHAGHKFIAVPESAGDQGDAVQKWTMEKAHHGQRLLIDPSRPDASNSQEL